MINVSKLKEGIVIDHIKAGHGYKIFQQLGLDKLDDVVVLMRNVDSTKMGRKDLIKIETNLDLNLEVLGLIDPNVTISYIKDGERVNATEGRAALHTALAASKAAFETVYGIAQADQLFTNAAYRNQIMDIVGS